MDTMETKSNKLTVDLRLICIVLVVIIVGMFAIWKPWHKTPVGNRTVSVSGQATLTAKPDEFIFTPAYEFKNTDKAAALAELSKKSDQIVAKLKALGVPSSKIKTDSSGYNGYPIYYDTTNTQAQYTLQLTVTINSDKQAQQVQDYLLTTSPTGSVSPRANFSDVLQKKLETQARDQATKEARAKADQSAKNLGFKVGEVKSIDDGNGFGGGIYPLAQSAGDSTSKSSNELSVQPGENTLNYSVTVVYFID